MFTGIQPIQTVEETPTPQKDRDCLQLTSLNLKPFCAQEARSEPKTFDFPLKRDDPYEQTQK